MRSISTVCVVALGAAACGDAAAPPSRQSVTVPVVGFKCAGSPQMSPANATLAVGDSVLAYARTGCTTIEGDASWETSDDAVASVASRGSLGSQLVAVITARRTGTAVITARSVVDPTNSAAMAVVVR